MQVALHVRASGAAKLLVARWGPTGSARFPIQRRKRKARSLRVWLPNRAVPMMVSTTTTSITARTSPSTGWSIPMLTGVTSEATPVPADRQGTRSRIAGSTAPGPSASGEGAWGEHAVTAGSSRWCGEAAAVMQACMKCGPSRPPTREESPFPADQAGPGRGVRAKVDSAVSERRDRVRSSARTSIKGLNQHDGLQRQLGAVSLFRPGPRRLSQRYRHPEESRPIPPGSNRYELARQ